MQIDFLLNLFLNYPQLDDDGILNHKEIKLNDQCTQSIFNRLLNFFPYYLRDRVSDNTKSSLRPISRDKLTNQLIENSNQMLKILVIK